MLKPSLTNTWASSCLKDTKPASLTGPVFVLDRGSLIFHINLHDSVWSVGVEWKDRQKLKSNYKKKKLLPVTPLKGRK